MVRSQKRNETSEERAGCRMSRTPLAAWWVVTATEDDDCMRRVDSPATSAKLSIERAAKGSGRRRSLTCAAAPHTGRDRERSTTSPQGHTVCALLLGEKGPPNHARCDSGHMWTPPRGIAAAVHPTAALAPVPPPSRGFSVTRETSLVPTRIVALWTDHSGQNGLRHHLTHGCDGPRLSPS